MSVVTCFLMGGLGNQLFEIFTTLAFAIRTKRKVVFPYSKQLLMGVPRNTYWKNLLSSLKPMTSKNKENGYTNERLMSFQVIFKEENDLRYTEIPDVKHYNEMMLYGYFQSPKYFENEKDKIYSMIGIPELKEKNLNEFPQYFEEDKITISMHFRLGDYKVKQDYHPIMSYDYYEKSLMHLMLNYPLHKKVNVLYFCEKEDNDTVKKTVDKLSQLFHDFTFTKVDDNIEDWKQMLIMSNCNHNIIANSTFSWWGAYFNFYSNKIVCYPSLWFGPAVKFDNSAMYPEDWVKIDV